MVELHSVFSPGVAIGFEMAEYSFQEDDGTVEVCATLEDGCFNDRAFEVLSGFVTAGTATGEHYVESHIH